MHLVYFGRVREPGFTGISLWRCNGVPEPLRAVAQEFEPTRRARWIQADDATVVLA